MILTVDIGNTNVKIGAWDHDKLAFVKRFVTNPEATSDEYALKLYSLFNLVEFNSIQFDGAIISSVVPQLSRTIRLAIRDAIQLEDIMEISPGVKTGLNIKIDNPATLGSDIVCAAVAANHKYVTPTIMISLGTATTLFAINKEGELVGGSLIPGIQISLNALSAGTAQLPYIHLETPKKVIGTNTVDSMTSGVVYGNARMLDGMIDMFIEELGAEQVSLVANGGLANLIIPYCKHNIVINDDLVLEGLRIIYEKNTSIKNTNK